MKNQKSYKENQVPEEMILVNTDGNLVKIKKAAILSLAVMILSHVLLLLLPNDRFDLYFFLFRATAIAVMAIYFAVFFPENRRMFPVDSHYSLIVCTFGVVVYIAILFIMGVFAGLGENPSVSTFWVIVRNIWCFVIMAVFREYLRCRIVAIWSRRPLIMFTVSLIFTVSFIDRLKEMVNLTPAALTNMMLDTIVPILILNLFLNNAARSGGGTGNMILVGVYQGVYYICPFLPNIPKILEGIAVCACVLVMYIFMQTLQNKQKAHDRREERYPWPRFVATAVMGVILIMFVLGVFTYVPLVVISNSMKGSFERGDVVIIQKVKLEEAKSRLEIGDIIQYKSNTGMAIIHRIIEIRERGGARQYITQGDNNLVADERPVSPEQIEGIAWWYIPYIGYPTLFLTGR